MKKLHILFSLSMFSLIALAGCGGGESAVTPAPPPQIKMAMSKVTPDPNTANYSLMMYPQKFIVKILDQSGKPIAGQAVNWVANGNGWAIPSSTKTTTDGTAQVNWVPGYGVAPQLTATASNSQGATTITYNGQLKADVVIDDSKIPSTSSDESWQPQGNTGIARDVTPLSEPAGTYYATMVWDVGYTGIQRTGSDFDRQIQFSVWDQQGVPASIVKPGTSVCSNFGHEGSGVRCSNTYPWEINKTYRFEMTTETVVPGSTDITVYFIDVASGSRLFIATLRHAGQTNMQFANSFVEDFKRDSVGCQNVPERRAIFSNTQIRKGSLWVAAPVTSRHSYITDPTKTCANAGYALTNVGVELGIGGTVRNTQVVGGTVEVK